ncbi:MAG: hypothetical protein JO276_12135 [Sphingomonadaceae bacterium]|nr:hypothetical protein [Sphingomonadaceae bacterium]
MAAPTLFYARAKLLRLGLLSVLIGSGAALAACRLTGKEGLADLRELYLLYAAGPEGPRAFVLFFGCLFGLAGLVALFRLTRDRAAVTIRIDGVRVSGLLHSRMIPWRCLDSVTLGETRFGGRVHRNLILRSRRLPDEGRLRYLLSRRFSILADRLDATPAEIADWARAAEAARRRALLHHFNKPVQPAATAVGRRA